MELDELHVDQLGAGVHGKRVAVAGVFPRIRGDLVGLAHSARREHHRLRAERHEAPGLAPVGEGAHHAAVLGQKLRDGALHVDLEALVHAVVLQRADHLEPGAIPDVREARRGMSAEIALEDPSVLGAVEHGAPVLELPDAVGRLLRVELRHAPVVEHLAAQHRVLEVDLPGIARVHVRQRGRDPSFRHDRVGLPEERLAHHAHARALGGGLDGGAQPGAPGADHQHVDVVGLETVGHRNLTSWRTPKERRRT